MNSLSSTEIIVLIVMMIFMFVMSILESKEINRKSKKK